MPSSKSVHTARINGMTPHKEPGRGPGARHATMPAGRRWDTHVPHRPALLGHACATWSSPPAFSSCSTSCLHAQSTLTHVNSACRASPCALKW
jgi:hypothetical protein